MALTSYCTTGLYKDMEFYPVEVGTVIFGTSS